jgi:hypothetical protein
MWLIFLFLSLSLLRSYTTQEPGYTPTLLMQSCNSDESDAGVCTVTVGGVPFKKDGAGKTLGFSCPTAGGTTTYSNICTSTSGSYIFSDGGIYFVQKCLADDIPTTEKISYLKSTLIPAATAYFQKRLKVVPVSGNLAPKWCETFYIDSNGNPTGKTPCDNGSKAWSTNLYGMMSYPSTPYTTTGVTADFIIFVNMMPTQGNTIAYATTAASDQYNRPIIGIANFGPNKMDTSAKEKETQISTAIHEILHALGFSGSNFPYFTKHDGTKYASVTQTATIHGNSVTLITTPEIVKKVQEHYNCFTATPIGAELEDEGGGGTAGSHFEKLQMMAEVMTGIASKNPVYSPLHLALMDDSGWYSVNYLNIPGDMNQPITPMQWGYKQGCDFIMQSCANWPTSSKSAGFSCTPSSTTFYLANGAPTTKAGTTQASVNRCAEEGFTHGVINSTASSCHTHFES